MIDLKNWAVSSYNEDTPEELNYYINENQCEAGDIAYVFSHEDEEWTELEIVRIISRINDPANYDYLVSHEDVLLEGEIRYKADTSAEFITDNDCYLVWFKYV